jgi:hypothetical protein
VSAVAMPVGTLLIWLTAPHLMLGAFLLPLVIFAIVRLKPTLFRMTSITVPMTLVQYTGEHLALLEQRLTGAAPGVPPQLLVGHAPMLAARELFFVFVQVIFHDPAVPPFDIALHGVHIA